MHNATLVHDDIQDGDEYRRGRPTTWKRYGVAQAINIGDLGLMLPFAMVADMDIRPETRVSLTRLLAQQGLRAARGQQEMLSLLQDGRLTRGALPTGCGGYDGIFLQLAHPRERPFSRLLRGRCAVDRGFIPSVGHMFQVQDDILDLYGDKGGRSVGLTYGMVRSVHWWWSTSHVVLGMRNGCFPC